MNRAKILPGAATLFFVLAASFLPGLAAEAPPAETKGAETFSVSLPAAGRHEAPMPITRWGRYSLRTSGDHPTALSVADRRNGVMQRDGEPGQRHGRIDAFLEIGEYKVAVRGAKKAAGKTVVTATPFASPPGFKPTWLVPLKENRLSLDDMQQAAFWFEVQSDTSIFIEASGRNLAEVVLWRDGEWLVPTDNRPFTAKPKDETPLAGFALARRIPKGIYMVGLYGGKGRAWAVKSEEHPCYLKWGVDPLHANIRSSRTVPPKGYEEVMLAPGVTDVIVEGADRQRLTAEVTRLDVDFNGGSWMAGDSIHGKSASPRMRLHPSQIPETEGLRMLRIAGAPGRPFTLQTFGAGASSLSGNAGGAWWVSSLHSGNPQDQLGASGIVVNSHDGSLVAVQADTAGPREVARRFNLLDGMTAFIWVGEGGKYAFTPGGTKYKWRLGRYYRIPPPNHREPDMQEGSGTLELKPGLHLLTLEPVNKGIATFVLGKSSLLGGMIAAGKAAVGAAGDRSWDAPRPEVRFQRIALGRDAVYDVVLNVQAPELAAIVVRPSPLDPDAPVSLWLRPGEKVGIPLKLAGKRVLSVADIRGAAVPFELDGRRADKSLEAEAGDRTVTLAGSGSQPLLVVLNAVPPERLPSGKAPEFPDSRREGLPKFPLLAAGKAAFLDLDRNGSQPYALRVTEPGLYRIETTGRLDTRLGLSDRFRHFTREVSANGVGRNAMLIEYLLAGEYQVTAAVNGQSAGRLGLAAYRNPLVEGGALEPGIDNRKFIESFSGAGYDIRISRAGRYRLESMGLNGEHSLRLEDKDGWPLEPAVTDGARTDALGLGEYRLISLPAAQEGRRIARLTAIAEKRAIKGKGPHPLALNTTLASTWIDKGKGDSVGAPAVFTFSLPAPVSARLFVSDGFQGTLHRVGTDTAVAAWSGIRKVPLPMGQYRLQVAPKKKRNLAPYQVSVGTRNLIPGLAFDLARKETFAVNVGSASIVELGSQGMLDVAATLLASDGKTVIASNDDGYLDWNFSISRALKAGRYFLRVESAEPEFSSTTVFMRALADTAMDSLASTGGKAQSVACRLNRRLGVFPLGTGSGDLIACAAQGRSRIGLALEKADTLPGQWIAVAQTGGFSPTLSIPRSPGAKYRLKAWSETNSDETLTVSYLAATAQAADAKQAASGLSGQPEALGAGHSAWFKVDLGPRAPGHFRADSDQNPLAYLASSTTVDSAFETDGGNILASTERYAWVELRFEQSGRFRVKLEPMILEPGKSLTVDLMAGRPRVFETSQEKGSLGLLSIESDGGMPLAGVLLGTDAGAAGGAGERPGGTAGRRDQGPRFRLRGMGRGMDVAQALWMGAGRSATVALPGDARRVAVWNAFPAADGTRPMAKLAWTGFALVEGTNLAPGATTLTLDRATARAARLPKGRVRARVTLPPQGAALLKRPDGSMSLECDFDGEPQVREFRSDGGDLYLLALDGKARFEVAVFTAPAAAADDPARGAETPLDEGAGRLLQLAREGQTLIPVGAAKPLRLFYRGAARGADWIGADGRMRPQLADGAAVGPGGVLALRHGMGWARLDVCAAGTQSEVMACKWGTSLSPSGTTAIDRSSLSALHERANWFDFAIKDTQHVNFAAPLPVAAILLKDGAPIRYQEAWERFNWDLPLAPGKYTLGIRPFAGASLEGATLATLFRGIPFLGEKRPYSAFLGPGESRLLRFDVAKASDIGIGLRMSKETVEARLYDDRGRVLEQGKQEFLKLAPGAYHLWLRVPEGAEGTEVTANLFGQEAPPNEPPERLVKWIINGAEGSRPVTVLEQAAEAEDQAPAWERFLRRAGYDDGSGSSEAAAAEAGEGEGEGGYREDSEGSGEGEASPEGGEESGGEEQRSGDNGEGESE